MAALAGVRVLDLTRLLPGPFASLVLSDLGARVDKVEDAGAGDYTRLGSPQVAGMSAAFHALNRGKRSLVLDLKKPGGPAVLLRLAQQYDVLFEQFRPGVLDRLGAGHAALLAANPRLVVCALTGYGQTGPLRDRAGHDLNYLARSGLLGLQGPADGAPQIPAFQLADVSGGMWSVIAILAALRERDQGAPGKVIDISMLESVVPFATISLGRTFGGQQPERGNEMLTGGIAVYESYSSKDGEAVTIGALEPKFMTTFCRAVGIEPDLALLVPGPHQAAFKEQFRQVFASRTRAEWQAFSERHDCCVEPVLKPSELHADAQFVARGTFFEADAGDGDVVGQYRTPVTPRDLTPTPAPRQGEHSDEILADAGLSRDEVAALRASGVVR